ncbi:hypothetical protein ANN_22044 [Periplaneta americana]|uniref:Uncharacterized protein n=1 Tax=Periplaneta americana TaxID=6978 RepID=A0ABQ8S7X4_PERAM|nr:hypothetical protein ANN_22044 [Periplaneta americana]
MAGLCEGGNEPPGSLKAKPIRFMTAADGDCHHLCKLMVPVRHRWSINDVIGGIRNTVSRADGMAVSSAPESLCLLHGVRDLLNGTTIEPHEAALQRSSLRQRLYQGQCRHMFLGKKSILSLLRTSLNLRGIAQGQFRSSVRSIKPILFHPARSLSITRERCSQSSKVENP